MPNPSPSANGKLRGVLERIMYANEENHYTIATLKPIGERREVTVVGTLPGVQCGETLELNGAWTRHPVHGDQFKVKQYESALPANVYGIRKYLGSGLVPGIGKTYADKIVDKFGEDTLRVISEESGRLREIDGIGAKRAKEIKAAWEGQQAVRDVMMFLQQYGVSAARCQSLVKQYGNNASQILRNDPYRVAREISGIGFKTADQIARNLGIANESAKRIDAGILFALQTLESEGHTAYPYEELERYAAELLEVKRELILARIKAMGEARELAKTPKRGLIQLPVLQTAEQRIANAVDRISGAASGLPAIKVDAAITWAADRAGFAFAPEQAEALRGALTSKMAILTGGPGTGKTTILRALVEILKAKKARVLLASPTGRAAQRMAEATGAYAQTIHRLLKYDAAKGGFTANETTPLAADYVVVDEASMLDTRLAAALFRAIPQRAHLLLVGDIDQLPSVGAGNVLKDLIASERVATTRLAAIFRQGKDSGIVHVAHGILEGVARAPQVVKTLSDLDPAADIQFLAIEDPQACVDATVAICRDWLPGPGGIDRRMEVQVLAPMHRGVAGIGNLNAALQRALNPNRQGITIGPNTFAVGDKVLQLRNNYDKGLFNGDLGQVTSVDTEAGTLRADFGEGPVDFERGDLTDLTLAYATSIHKSQGSEFRAVVMPLLKQHFMLLQRNLVYTGITRGKERVLLVGDPTAYAMAIRNAESAERHTGLGVYLAEPPPS